MRLQDREEHAQRIIEQHYDKDRNALFISKQYHMSDGAY